jgi:hypothetical protein
MFHFSDDERQLLSFMSFSVHKWNYFCLCLNVWCHLHSCVIAYKAGAGKCYVTYLLVITAVILSMKCSVDHMIVFCSFAGACELVVF